MQTLIIVVCCLRESQEEELTREGLEGMTLSSETTHLRSATQEEVRVTRSQLLRDAVTNLSSIRASYLTAFSHMTQAVQASR